LRQRRWQRLGQRLHSPQEAFRPPLRLLASLRLN
jgi:hypothetical protein